MSDFRERLIVSALASPQLGHAERVFLIVVVMLPAEYVDGERRSGSAGMDQRGRFALHYDYLARHLHTSPEGAKKAAQRLAEKGWLSKRHAGTFGRPAGWQALDVRGDKSNRVTAGRVVPPYEMYAAHVRGDTVSPLTYKTPDHPSHAPADCVSRTPDGRGVGSYDESAPDVEVARRRTAERREASR